MTLIRVLETQVIEYLKEHQELPYPQIILDPVQLSLVLLKHKQERLIQVMSF